MLSTETCLLGINSTMAPTKSAFDYRHCQPTFKKPGSIFDVVSRLCIICKLDSRTLETPNCARPDSDWDVIINSGKPPNQGAEDCFDAADRLADISEASSAFFWVVR